MKTTFTFNFEEYKKLTIEEQERIKNQAKQEYDQYQVEFEEKKKRFANLKKEMLSYTINPNARNYIEKRIFITKTHDSHFDYYTYKRYDELIAKEENDKKITEQQLEKQGQEYRKTQKALTICLENGWKLGKPDISINEFILEQAIEVANGIVYKQLIKEKMNNTKYISFSGDDNCEHCEGWDGESRRCQCGNRRVGWDSDGDFDCMTVYAVAW